MEVVEVCRAGQMIAQKRSIIGDRDQHEDRHQKRYPQSPGTAAQVSARTVAGQAFMDEQSRNQEHEGHEETVIEQYDQVEAKPTHPVAIAEMGEVDGGMV